MIYAYHQPIGGKYKSSQHATPANKTQRNAAKVVALNEFVKIGMQQLENEAQVVAKLHKSLELHNVRRAGLVLQDIENTQSASYSEVE